MDGTAEAGPCPEGPLAAALQRLGRDDEDGLTCLSDLILSYPLDPRLHFLKGSVLAGLQRYTDARVAMARSIEIAPDFALARFQLGFLDLTSGRALDAIGVWSPLLLLSENEPLRVLAEGLINLAADNFSETRRLLQKGMALNRDNPLINADMQLILDEIANKPDSSESARLAQKQKPEEEPAQVSAAHQLLQQYQIKDSINTKKS